MSTLVHEWLPTYDIHTEHRAVVRAPNLPTYEVASALDLSSSWITRTLFRIRGLPAAALRREGLKALRFKLLSEEPPRGYVLGIIGKFWTLSGHLVDYEPTAFRDFDEAGFARAAWSFEVTALDEKSCELRTVTRIACTDDESRRRFLRYWRVIGPFSGVIRREALAAVRRQAEGRASLAG